MEVKSEGKSFKLHPALSIAAVLPIHWQPHGPVRDVLNQGSCQEVSYKHTPYKI